MTTPPPTSTQHDPRVDVLDQRVTGLESSLATIGENINRLASKFEERNKIHWAVLVSAGVLLIAILGVIGTAWKDPIERIIGRQEMDLRIIQESVVPRVEHEYHWTTSQQADEDLKKRLDRIETTVFAGSPGLSRK